MLYKNKRIATAVLLFAVYNYTVASAKHFSLSAYTWSEISVARGLIAFESALSLRVYRRRRYF